MWRWDESLYAGSAAFYSVGRLPYPAGSRTRCSASSAWSSAPHLFGSRLGQFECELRALLQETASDGVFAERSRNIALDL
jgi:hypothetical protein